MRRLRFAAERAKRALSSSTKATSESFLALVLKLQRSCLLALYSACDAQRLTVVLPAAALNHAGLVWLAHLCLPTCAFVPGSASRSAYICASVHRQQFSRGGLTVRGHRLLD